MKLIAAVSPSCGAKLDVNPKEETVVCKYAKEVENFTLHNFYCLLVNTL